MDLLIFDELFSSSSESSDSEEEILDIIFENNENHPRRRKARVQNFIENVIYEYDNKSFQENFRRRKLFWKNTHVCRETVVHNFICVSNTRFIQVGGYKI
ncbi:uncharacterized protein LOC120357125 isoform X3 [Solenopsis invicta]|uniref:uncharacterized protein LOC120357125 isoform X3 n=1 Tax=Solenopsis invicta TaxID=13686 RepID=UPI00193D133C|nr:uncharacterized protein LOC120357125 isoform X3 [Solenopsis invicta]